jgi:pyruvate formate lyase activating enzyme
VRENHRGVLHSLSAGRVVSVALDPIEKKPLFHFLPGSTSLSVATVGCNFRCAFCQNWSISQWPRSHADQPLPGDEVSPAEIARTAAERGAGSISYTYTEPTVFWELVRDTATEAHRRGIRNVLVTNGYQTDEAWDYMDGLVDAANVDLKAARPEPHLELTGARPEPVRRNIERLWRRGIWVEVTTLLVPGWNDGDDDLRAIAQFLAGVDRDLPWHVSRFHPDYQVMDRGATPPERLRRACEIGAEAGLRYVYPGNLPGADRESTSCPACQACVIERRGFRVGRVRLQGGKCAACGAAIAGVGLP